jgi:hypothetical protein
MERLWGRRLPAHGPACAHRARSGPTAWVHLRGDRNGGAAAQGLADPGTGGAGLRLHTGVSRPRRRDDRRCACAMCRLCRAEPITWFVIVPFALASLLTGLVQSLGTTWGLCRHYWVVFKLLLNVLATLVLLRYTQTVSYLAGLAAQPGRNAQTPPGAPHAGRTHGWGGRPAAPSPIREHAGDQCLTNLRIPRSS